MRRRLAPPTWPQIVRALGVGAALYGFSPWCEDRAATLGFAGTLILAPLAAGEQDKRNRRRGLNGGGRE